MQYLSYWDLLLTPFYLIVLSIIAKKIRNKRYPIGHPLRKYFMPGLYVKFAGAIIIALLYAFYYKGGDTFNFIYHSRVINSSLNESFQTWVDLLFRRSYDVNPNTYKYIKQMYWFQDKPSYTVAAIAAVMGLLNGTSYIPIALLFAFISYTGIWAMFRTFVNLYPKLHKQLAIAFLFVPSTFIWGSAVFKDTLCMFGLGWLTYTTFRIFINRDFSIKNILMLILSFYIIAVLKIYILIAFIPALNLWLLLTYSRKIRNIAIRWFVNLSFVAVSIAGFLFFANYFAEDLNEYALENIAAKSLKTQGWITYVSDLQEGSAYDLGAFEPTPEGMLSKFPQAVTVTLYRPFLWEVKKPIVLLSALEAFVFLIMTFYVFFKRGFFKTFKDIFNDQNLSFFFIYSIIFAFAVGISTGNFGSLSRYKIPLMPFFAALLVILYYYSKPIIKTSISNAKKQVHHIA